MKFMKFRRKNKRLYFGEGDQEWSVWDPAISSDAPVDGLADDWRWLTNPGLCPIKDAIAKLRAIRRTRLTALGPRK